MNMHRVASACRRYLPTILSALAAVGTVVTAVMAAKKTPEALMDVYRAEGTAEDGELTIPEKVKAVLPHYIPALVSSVATIACIFGANALNRKQQASLISAYVMAQQAYKQYRERVKTVVGEEADHIVEKAIEYENSDPQYALDEPQTFYEEHYGKFFERTMKQVMQAEYYINRNLAIGGVVTLNDFFDFLELEHLNPDGDVLEWNDYDGEVDYGYQWIDFEHRYYETDDGLTVCAIDMPFPPHLVGEPD